MRRIIMTGIIGLVLLVGLAGLINGCGSQPPETEIIGLSAKGYITSVLERMPKSSHIYYVSGVDISVSGVIHGETSLWNYGTNGYGYKSYSFYPNGEIHEVGADGYEYDELNVLDNWEIDSPIVIATTEASGGSQIRVANEGCRIFMYLYPSYEAYSDPIWVVDYKKKTSQTIKTFYVNARTGSLEAMN